MATALITGGHAGIGLECARQLASQWKYNLVLAGRNPDLMEPIAEELRKAYGIKVNTLKLDTSSLQSVRNAASQFRKLLDAGQVDAFQVLLCNAGGRHDGAVTYSIDGYETTFATNCLGHFLLIELLEEKIAANGRILFTASGTHDPDTPDGKMVGKVVEPDAVALANDGRNGGKALSGGVRYATSKLCTVLYAYEIDRILRRADSSVAAIAFDPGSIPETGFLRGMPRPVQWLAKTAPMKFVMKRIGITQGSLGFSGASLARLAADPAYANASGKYFQSSGDRLIERRSSKMSYDEGRAGKLWNDSKQLARLQPGEEAPQLR